MWFQRYPAGQTDSHIDRRAHQYFATAPTGKVITVCMHYYRATMARGLNCSVRKPAVNAHRQLRKPPVDVHRPLRPAAWRATTAPSQPRPLPTVARVATCSQPQLRRPYKACTSVAHRRTLGIISIRYIDSDTARNTRRLTYNCSVLVDKAMA